MKLYRISEVALMLGLHADTLRRWIRSESIEVITTNGGHRRFTEAHVTQLRKLMKNF